MRKSNQKEMTPQGDSPCHQHVIFTVMLILQSNLPENKSIAFALKQIYSINHTSAQAICCKIGVNPNNTLKELNRSQSDTLIHVF
jgi:ribosomal protein S13